MTAPAILLHEFVREIEQRVWRKEVTKIIFTLHDGNVVASVTDGKTNELVILDKNYSFASALQALNEALHESKKQTEA